MAYLCGEPACGQSFDKHNHLMEHMKEKHPSELRHVCSECGNKYKRKKDLETHVGTHFPEQRKLFHCKAENCVKSFISGSNLRVHMRIHTSERQFVCKFRIPIPPTSSASTSTPTTQTTETTTDNTDEINMNDTTNSTTSDGMMECGKQFAFKHVLERHILTHSKPPKVKQPKKKLKTAAQEVAKIVGVVHYPPLSASKIPTPPTSSTPSTSSSSPSTKSSSSLPSSTPFLPSSLPILSPLPPSSPSPQPAPTTVVF